MDKSTRHSKVIGDFGEMLTLNWLSRSGFESARVDHTGLDIVAWHPRTGKRLGITVKSRARDLGKEAESVNVFKRPAQDKALMREACRAFGCDEAWLAVYVETEGCGDLYLTSFKHYESKYQGLKRKTYVWTVGPLMAGVYHHDPEVHHVSFCFEVTRWSLPLTKGGKR